MCEVKTAICKIRDLMNVTSRAFVGPQLSPVLVENDVKHFAVGGLL